MELRQRQLTTQRLHHQLILRQRMLLHTSPFLRAVLERASCMTPVCGTVAARLEYERRVARCSRAAWSSFVWVAKHSKHDGWVLHGQVRCLRCCLRGVATASCSRDRIGICVWETEQAQFSELFEALEGKLEFLESKFKVVQDKIESMINEPLVDMGDMMRLVLLTLVPIWTTMCTPAA